MDPDIPWPINWEWPQGVIFGALGLFAFLMWLGRNKKKE